MSAPFVFMVLNFVHPAGHPRVEGRPGGAASSPPSATIRSRPRSTRPRSCASRPQDKLAEYETKLKDADAEIKKMVDGMRADAEADKARILDERRDARPRR